MNFFLYFSWVNRKPVQTLEFVPIPPLRDNELHSMTVIPYLLDYHYGEDPDNPSYMSEHQLNGKLLHTLLELAMWWFLLNCIVFIKLHNLSFK